MLEEYKRSFIEFALAQGALKFGEFQLKSGRISPYFFNAGQFHTGNALAKLGQYYAAALKASGIHVDGLFGPAYKGIPLVAATAVAMASQYQLDIPYTFNRKEAKDHGEGGTLVGAPLAGDVVIIDDVITAGTAIREVMPYFEGDNARAVGVMVAIDRQEKGQGDRSAIQEVERTFDLSVINVISLDDIVQYMQEEAVYEQELNAIGSYRAEFGIASGL